MPGVASAANLGKLVPMRTRAVWALRTLWFLLPLTVGQAASDAIASADHAVPQVMTIGLWVLWAGGMVASMVPVPITLTGLRIFAAGITPVALWTMFDTNFSAISIIAGVHAIATGFVALNPLIGDRFIDGGSYGDERRMALRPPAQVGYFLVPFVWALMAASTATGPLLLANKQWIAGLLTTAVGAGVVAIGARAVHQLTQRWIVFVPTGLVLHDQMLSSNRCCFAARQLNGLVLPSRGVRRETSRTEQLGCCSSASSPTLLRSRYETQTRSPLPNKQRSAGSSSAPPDPASSSTKPNAATSPPTSTKNSLHSRVVSPSEQLEFDRGRQAESNTRTPQHPHRLTPSPRRALERYSTADDDIAFVQHDRLAGSNSLLGRRPMHAITLDAS